MTGDYFRKNTFSNFSVLFRSIPYRSRDFQTLSRLIAYYYVYSRSLACYAHLLLAPAVGLWDPYWSIGNWKVIVYHSLLMLQPFLWNPKSFHYWLRDRMKRKKIEVAAGVVSAGVVGELHNYFIGSIAHENHFQSS